MRHVPFAVWSLVSLCALVSCDINSGTANGGDASTVVRDAAYALDGERLRDAPIRLDGGADKATGTSDANRSADRSAPDDGPTMPDAKVAMDASGGGLGPYAATGSSTVTTASFMITSPDDTFTTTAYLPSASGPHPVVILSSGFEQTGAAYAPYASRLASWGIVTFLRDDPGAFSSLTATNLADDVGYMVATWLAMTNADASSALHGAVDVTRIGLAGHSRGGQVALLAAEMGAKGKIQGVFGLDPVDTETDTVEARSMLATIGVPVAFVGETTDATGGIDGMPCAPAADDYLVLYMSAASPAVALTSIGADHTMYEDPNACAFCTLCTAGTASAQQVLDTSVRYLTAFFARQLLGDETVGSVFQGAGASKDIAAHYLTLESK